MQTPQLENGYTRIANEILDNIVKTKLNGTQYKIIMVVWRYTYGFCRKEHEFSLTFLSTATDTNKNQIKRELSVLIEKRILTVTKEADFNTARTLSFNKLFEQWELDKVEGADPSTVIELDKTQGTKKDTVQGANPSTKKETIKENYKESIIPYDDILQAYNEICCSLPKIKSLSSGRKSKIKTRWKELKTLDKFKDIFTRVESSSFLTGNNNKNWKCSFDWLIKNDDNYVKVLEGKYDNKDSEGEKPYWSNIDS